MDGESHSFWCQEELIDPFDLSMIFISALAADMDGLDPTSSILDAKYEAVDLTKVAEQQKHLSLTQHNDLAALLRKFPRLFDGELRYYPCRKVHLELLPYAHLIHQCPYLY